ncbi:MAG: lysine-sensitive aspartokinase 3 [Ignavibacteria bacterium]|nr:lysine-sensitive aspartokinase 3 [Ignavibacteria bacterium]
MIVMKFGGTSVGGSAAISRLVQIVKSRIRRNPVIVVSAISQATDTLHKTAMLSAAGEFIAAKKSLGELKIRHLNLCRELLGEKSLSYGNTVEKVNEYFSELLDLIKGVNLLSELSDRSLAKIITYGELLSSYIIYEVLNENGIKCGIADARDFIFTDNNYLKSEPDTDLIKEYTPSVINEIMKGHNTVITQGFISNTIDKVTTTLGRGGSDFTASLIGMALDAEEIEIWTDVDGVHTADPRKVKNTKSVSVMSFEEAAELAYFGAKILHPSTIQPAIDKNIPVRILNSMSPESEGTLVLRDDKVRENGVRSISCKENITVLNVFSAKMLNSYGFLRKLFEIFDKHKTSVDLITTSEVNVSLTLDSDEHLNKIVTELSLFSRVSVENDKALVCVVGKDLKNTKGVTGRIFGAVWNYNITMVSQGASAINISFVVNRSDLNNVLQALHDEFFETKGM